MGLRAARKEPFDIDMVLQRVSEAIRTYPKAALFQLAEEGFSSVFEQLCACLISVRTRDEMTVPIARRLFARARTPSSVAALAPTQIDRLITPSTFHTAKAYQIHAIARRVVDEFDGDLPGDFAVLTSFKGVGPKCANLVLAIACDETAISVDIHVHRVTNRWGFIAASTPEKSLKALEQVLPRRHWSRINPLLVPFGKHVCTGTSPKCSTCPVLSMCRQVGVTTHR